MLHCCQWIGLFLLVFTLWGRKRQSFICSAYVVLPAVVLKQNKLYLLASFSLKLLSLPSSALCCPFVFVASQPIPPTSLSSSPSYPFKSAPSPLNQARMRTAVCQVWIDTPLVDLSAWPLLGPTQIFVSVKAPENGNCAITVMADTDRSLAWVKIWLASHYRNDSSCKIIQFPCKVKYFIQNLVQEEVRRIFLWCKQSIVSD